LEARSKGCAFSSAFGYIFRHVMTFEIWKDTPDLFYNRAGRLRAFWRLALFVVAYFVARSALFLLAVFGLAFALPKETYDWLLVGSNWGFVVQSALYFAPAALVGWACGYALEDLPWRALGLTFHRGWVRDLLIGFAVGAASVCVAACVGLLAGNYRFDFDAAAGVFALSRTLVASGLIFLLAATAEEMTFRGYPLQTAMRSWPVWIALLPVSLPFAYVHLDNPNVAPGFTFANTALAGAWLAIAYWRTRSLWFPLGLHWGWNWVQGAVLGSPVSGITQVTPSPLLRFADVGHAWVGGGAYGIEGGAACTLALLLSTVFVWRTRLVSAAPGLRRFTDGENPNPPAENFLKP
jgi:membrane protease YdiL (CAAX protease family)